MEMYYKNDILFVNIDERVNFSLINKVQKKLYRIIDDYAISNIVLNIISSDDYDSTLIDDLINDYKSKYNGRLIIK